MSIREGKGQDLDGSDADGWDEEERIYTNRKSAKKMEWRGTWLTRGEGEGKEKYGGGEQQIEMGKVSNGMN